MGETWSPDRDQRPEAASSKPQVSRNRAQARATKRQATSCKLDKAWALGYYKIMKEILNYMPVYYIDTEKNQTVKMNKQLKKRVKRKICSLKKQKK